MSEYEKQVIQLTKFKQSDYGDHQDYLASLIRHIDKWLEKNDPKGAIFSSWDTALADWFDQCVHVIDDGDGPLPDFPDRTEPIPEFVPEEVPYEREPTNEPEAVSAVSEVREEVSAVSAASAPVGPEPSKATEPLALDTAEALVPDKAKKWGVKKPTRVPTPYDILTGERDRYGIIIGTKTHDAVLMYERGTSAKEILHATGGRHYNILKRLKRDGHKVVRLTKNRFRVTHKDDVVRSLYPIEEDTE